MFQGDCTLENNYGYKEGKPCILLKLNRIYGWNPEPFNLRQADRYTYSSYTTYQYRTNQGIYIPLKK